MYFIQLEKRFLVRESKVEFRDVQWLLFEWNKLILGNENVLYCKISINEQVVLFWKFCRIIFKEFYEDMGYLGVERVFDLIKVRFYWLYMKNDIIYFVIKVCRCIK